MTDNSQFTEEERAEAFRLEHAGHLKRQTAALESIRSYVGWLLAIVVTQIALVLIVVIGSRASF